MLLPSSRHLRAYGSASCSAAAFKTYMQTCASLLDKCLAAGSLAGGQAVHGHAIKTGISSLRPLPAKILAVYSTFGRSSECAAVLEESRRDIFSWNMAIAACFSRGEVTAARHLFDEMPKKNHISWTLMIDGLMKSGRVSEAIVVLRRSPSPTVVSWTAAIAGLVQNGLPRQALLLLRNMLDTATAPNEITITSSIRASIAACEFNLGKNLVCFVVKTGYESFLSISNSLITLHIRMKELHTARQIFDRMQTRDVVSWTAILDLYVEEGDIKSARRMFDEMPEKNEVTWSAMVARYNQNGQAMEALKLFESMLHHGLRLTPSSLSPVICAAGAVEDGSLGSILHGFSIKLGMSNSDFISSSLITMYCNCKFPDEARHVFEVHVEKNNAVCWNAMISGYCENGSFPQALELFDKMPQRNRATWNGMIAGLVAGEAYLEATEIFTKMAEAGRIPCAETFSSVLCACAGSSALEMGSSIHAWIVKLGHEDDLFIGTAMTDMYAKSGDIISSKRVFSLMKDKKEASWSAAINGLATNGLGQEALLLFEQITKPSLNMFLVVLSACAHNGLVEEAFHCFRAMKERGIVPLEEHYACLVDLLARAGLLSEAEKVAEAKGGVSAWAALLSRCRWEGEAGERVAEKAAERLREIEKGDHRSYVLLSNVYASVGRWGDMERVRALMGPASARKIRGCSWVGERGRNYGLFRGDVLQEKEPEICATLDLLMLEVNSLGLGEIKA